MSMPSVCRSKTKEGSLTETICITYGSESADIIVNKAIAKLSSSVYSFTEGATSSGHRAPKRNNL